MRDPKHRGLCPSAILRHMVGVLAVSSTVVLAGCSQCGDPEAASDIAPETAGVVAPAAPDAVTLGLASHFADTTPMFITVRDPRAVSSAYRTLKPHLDAIVGSELGMVETDMRNTLGIDLLRPDTFAEAGVAPDGGFSFTVVADRVVGGVVLSDARRFEERIVPLLQASPFNYNGPVERRRVNGAQVLGFRTTNADHNNVEVVLKPPYAFFVSRAGSPGTEQIIEQVTAPGDASLANDIGFHASMESAVGYQAHVYISPEMLRQNRPEDILEIARGLAPEGATDEAVIEAIGNIGVGTIGMRLEADGIDVRWIQQPDTAVVARFNEITAGSEEPRFAPLAVPDVYAYLRLTLEPSQMLDLIRIALPESADEALSAQIATGTERLGFDVESEIVPALGNTAMVLFTRARLLTLSRAMNSGTPGEFFSGLGVVIAFEIRDRERVATALTNLAGQMEDRARVNEISGATVLEFRDAAIDIGNVVVSDHYLLVVPSRQRDEVLEQLGSETSDISWVGVASARELITSPRGNGMFIDVHRVVDGPIGQVAFARLPDEVRRLLARLSRVHATTSADETSITTDLTFSFLDADATAP